VLQRVQQTSDISKTVMTKVSTTSGCDAGLLAQAAAMLPLRPSYGPFATATEEVVYRVNKRRKNAPSENLSRLPWRMTMRFIDGIT